MWGSLLEIKIIARSLDGVGEYPICLIDHGGVPMIAATVGMLIELEHESTVARFYDLKRGIRLNVKNAVIVTPFIHTPCILFIPEVFGINDYERKDNELAASTVASTAIAVSTKIASATLSTSPVHAIAKMSRSPCPHDKKDNPEKEQQGKHDA